MYSFCWVRSKWNEFSKIKNSAENCGITVLDGESAYIERNGQKITVTGTYFCPVDFSVYSEKNDSDGFNIWLHHFPEDFEKTADGTKSAGYQMDLMFSGHAHGGLNAFKSVPPFLLSFPGYCSKIDNQKYFTVFR